MKKIFHLSTCNTCQRIIGELDGGQDFELQDIKTEPITAEQIQPQGWGEMSGDPFALNR